ncbi:MAG: flagellum-specific ATP synthase FliI, partial [Natronospirillum sp.]
YPAIDIEASISRAMPQVVTEGHLHATQRFKQFYSRYQQSQDLISIGAYKPGQDQELDSAVQLMPSMRTFLRQGLREKIDFNSSAKQLLQVLSSAGAPAPATEKGAKSPGKAAAPGRSKPGAASGGIKPMPRRPER